MNCVINNLIDHYAKQGRKLEAIKRYLKMRYNINIDKNALKERIRMIKFRYEVK